MNAAADAVVNDADEMVAMLRESIDRYTADHYSFEQRWKGLRSACRYSETAWADYADMGWLALRLPEHLAGLAAQANVTSQLMEAVGAKLLLEPILASVILSTGLILKRANASQQSELLPKLADGSLKLAFAHQESLNASAEERVDCEYRNGALYGSKIAVLHGDCADRFIVSARDAGSEHSVSLYLVDSARTNVTWQNFSLLDGRGAANVRFHGASAERLAAAGPADADAIAIVESMQEAAVALCSETLGAINALNNRTNSYLKERKQFGKPIGANQALQHRMAEMYMLEQEVRALNLAAQRALTGPVEQRDRIISGARAYACGAARRIAAEAVQMHGGIGITDELDVSHYYRRLMVVGTLFGNRDFHLARFAATAMPT
jgi:alkylation response protein AidB-like acyl-CoA dehydrogenase